MSKSIASIFMSLITSLVLSSTSYAHVYEFTNDNRLTLLQDARAAVDFKLNLVRNAKHHIHIMTYYWDKDGYPLELIKELKLAHDRGVDVRIMTTFIPSFVMDLLSTSKRTLYKGNRHLTPAVLSYLRMAPGNHQAITNNIHEKIFLVDGQVAILGGRNVSDNDYRAKDLEVKLEGAVVNEVQAHFEKMFTFFIDIKKKNRCYDESDIECAQNFEKLKFTSTDKLFYPEQPKFEDGARARILTNEALIQQYQHNYLGRERFSSMKDDIIDSVIKTQFTRMRGYNYFIMPIPRYKKFLEDNLALGKRIDIMTNSMTTSKAISDKGYLYGLPEMKNLVERGLNLHQWLGEIKIGEDRLFYLHEKVILFDDDHGFIGSHNFGLGSTSVSSEITIEFYSKPVVQTLVNVYDKEFEDTAITKNANLPMINQEMEENKKMIRLLQTGFIKTITSELY